VLLRQSAGGAGPLLARAGELSGETTPRASSPAASGRGLLPRDWTIAEQITFLVVAAAVLILSFVYCFYMNRTPVFDEVGLHNPVYTFLTNGKMTYPMHGHPDAMFVHPPTHYWVTAQLMKNLNLDLFDASAAPIFFFTLLSVATLWFGRFEFTIAFAALLALFSSVFVWSEFYTVRPDLHVTVAWITGLLMLQAAKNREWPHAWMFGGCAVLTFSSTLHYWGIVGFLGVGVYALWFLADTPRERWFRGLEVMAAGCLLVGGLYALVFVIPQYDNIRAITEGVQGSGDWRDAVNRHKASYAAFAQRVGSSTWPSVFDFTGAGLTPRWLLDRLLQPVFDLRIPAIVLAAPLLFAWKSIRPLITAGLILPAFVLLYSQGKQIGYTGYFTPEIYLYVFGCIALALQSTRWFVSRLNLSASVNVLFVGFVVSLSFLTLREVPISMGESWRFRPDIDVLDVNRAAGNQIVGTDATVALVSAGNWYTAGGSVAWNAWTDLYGAEPAKRDFLPTISVADAVVSQTGNWWNSQTHAVPLNLWYSDGRLGLRGFILYEPEPTFDQLYLASRVRSGEPVGFLIGADSLERLIVSSSGNFQVAFLICDSIPVRPPGLRLFYSFPVSTPPGQPGPQLTILAGDRDKVSSAQVTLRCSERQVVTGNLESINRSEFLSSFRANDRHIRFVNSRDAVLAIQRAGPR